MNISVKILGFCASGNHIAFEVTTPTEIKKITLMKQDFQLDLSEYESAVIAVLRNFVKESGLTNWTQIKTAIEGKVFKI